MIATLPVFTENKQCEICPLYEGVTSPCVPTVPYIEPTRTDKAVIIVGEAPGANEDTRNRPFVGKAGLMLRKCYIEFPKLADKADIYLSNAVRCRPPQNTTPNSTQIKLCQGYLLADIKILQEMYDEVIILTVGGPATKTVRGLSLKKSYSQQGQPSDFEAILPKTVKGQQKYYDARNKISKVGHPKPCKVFTTFHPAYLLREPSVGLAVKAHLQMLADYLDGKLENEFDTNLEIAEAPAPPPYSIKRLSLDIETYGCFLNLPPQTMFHPRRSETVDNIKPGAMIRTTGLTWRDPDGTEHHAIFQMQKSQHRRRLWAWLRKCNQDPEFQFLLGQNIVFDIMYLRYCYPECKMRLNSNLPIMDLMITNYLHDEGRPEKSLKNLAPLFGVTRYDQGEIRRYERDDDLNLWKYNCQDTFATLRLQEKLEQEIVTFYKADTTKLSPFCMEWYSNLLWLIVWMSETGIKMSGIELQTLLDRYSHALEVILEHAQDEYGAPLRGKGSEIAKRTAMKVAYEEVQKFCEMWGHEVPQMITTPAKQMISFNEENRNALMNVLDKNSREYKLIKLMGSYQNVSGMMDRYLYPLLVGRGKKHDNPDSLLIDNVAYPKWFPVPSEFEDSSAGGTKQARIVAKGPPCQTFPPAIKNTITGRFNNGWLIWYDYSQIELRVAALLSNDPVMMEEYQGSPDLHTKTAKLIFGDDIVNHPNFKTVYRHGGKTLNFLMLYRGGAYKFRETLMRDVGIDYPMSKCEAALRMFRKRHARLFEWQDELIAFVDKYHYYELPLLGQSRLFLGGKISKRKSEKEIANLPVQAIAADIALSAQFSLWKEFKRRGLTAVVPINIYDSALIECKTYDLVPVKEVMQSILPNPPYYEALCNHLGRRLPVDCEASIYRVKNGKKILTEKEIKIVT